MPCYIMAANRLRVLVPEKIDEKRIEEYLRKQLQVPTRRHKDLHDAINKMLAQDPEVLRIMLIEAVAYAREQREKDGPPDRLSQLRKESPYVKKKVQVTQDGKKH